MGENGKEAAMDEELKPQPASAPEGPAQVAASTVEDRARHASASGRMPTLYIGHGAPPLVDDPLWVAQLAAWAKALPRPSAVLIVSAHWENAPLTIGATRTGTPLIYDFGGFPERYYRTQYPSPGAPELAADVRRLLSDQPLAEEPDHGLDHGAYVPLTVMYPDADVHHRRLLDGTLQALDPDSLAPPMLQVRRDREIHKEEGGWFVARWHFSFDRYRDPRQMGVGPLRVFNHDRLAPVRSGRCTRTPTSRASPTCGRGPSAMPTVWATTAASNPAACN